MINSNDLRQGSTFENGGEIFTVLATEHIKLARGSATIKAKIKNLRTGSSFEQSFRSGDKFKLVRIERSSVQYLYADGDLYHFMDTQSFEQLALSAQLVSDVLPYLKEGNTAVLLSYQENVIGVELPITVELKVEHTDTAVRGDTVSGVTKPATLETGVTVQVPIFVNSGDVLRVDTRTGAYMERV